MLTAPAAPLQFVTISTVHPAAIGNAIAGFSSVVWAASNRAIFLPFRLDGPLLIKHLFAYNGAVVSGNIDAGIYDAVGTRLVSAGSTPHAGTNGLQLFDVTDTLLGRGQFYLACALDNATGTVFRQGVSVPTTQLMGVVQMASAFPLPSTAVFAAAASANIPMLGCTGMAVL